MASERTDSLRTAMFEEVLSGEVLARAAACSQEYAAAVREQRVFPDDATLEKLNVFDEALPERTGDALEILDKLHTAGSPGTVAQRGGRYFGLVNGSLVPAALGARILADAWDQNAVLYATSPINAKLEEVVEGWLRSLFGLPETVVAGYVSGTSLATVSGLAAARHRLLDNAGWDINRQGLRGAPKLRIVAGRHTHGTAIKAVSLLGFGTDCVEWVDVDEQGRLGIDALPDLDDRTIVIAQAGNVNSGSFDPIRAICERAREAGAWVHVDGAFGLWAAACNRLAHLADGIELAHSWSVDAHKTLNAPYDCGIILCADREALVTALQNSGAYVVFSENRDGMLYTPEMSRRTRAVEVWAALRYLGRSGLDQLVGGLHERARQFADELAANGFEVLNDVVFNQVIVASGDDALTSETMRQVQASGEMWAGGSMWFDRAVIRISVCSWATTAEDVSRSVRALVAARASAAANDGERIDRTHRTDIGGGDRTADRS